ncbi:MAG: glycerophosphodiester phosphodiesterase [Clostridia bacterium]|nr:glycerophosphodiester phosphodiesterase [Clostridia bacterium]
MIVVSILIAVAVVVAGLYLFLVSPAKRRSIAPFDTYRYAHRGLHSGDSRVPENSLAAFRRAAEAGLAVELDVRLSADGQVVVFHDNTLLRMCGIDKRVDALTYAELKDLTLLDSGESIPLLSEVLAVLDGAPLLCEFKNAASFTDTTLCEAAWEILKDYKGPVCVESFNPMMVRWFKKNQPQVVRGILSCIFEPDNKEVSPFVGKLLTYLLTNFLARPHFIAYQHTDTQVFSFRVCRGLFRAPTFAWTIRTPEQETAAAANRFDAVIFEGYEP